MKKIIVASQNPVKVKATLDGFRKMFPKEQFKIKGIKVDSEVKDQPLSDEETLLGAENRAHKAMKNYPKADYYIGIEGGVEQKGKEMYTFAWVAIVSKKIMGRGKTASFLLPPKVVKLIKEGKELGAAMDRVFNKTNSKQKEGAIGILTGGIIDRKTLYTPAIISALIPFKKSSLYNK
jgi:inosine/xanthosine triphosphatase